MELSDQNTPTKGVLLVNLGTPDAPEKRAVSRYLKQFLLDRRVIDYSYLGRNLLVRGIILPFRTAYSTKLYQRLWTPEGSPLKVYGERVAKGLQKLMAEDYFVELAMRYQNPSIELALDKLLDRQIEELIVLPMFPQYASATTGSVHEEVMRLLSKRDVIPAVHFLDSFYDYEPMVAIFVENSQKYKPESYDHILFSFHGLPQRQLKKADSGNHCLQSEICCQTISPQNRFCYSAQCHATAKALANKLGLKADQYTVSFQSRLGKEVWAQPYTSSIIKARAELGDKKLLVFCPAFVSDCLETTIEIACEYREDFLKMGGKKLDLVESLNDNPKWIAALRDLIVNFCN